ncbi:MAG: hypothetical protein WCW33_05430 [Candidatus Babeliales bacterium]
MKRIVFVVITLFLACPYLGAGHGGDAFAGGLAGGVVGGLVVGAASRSGDSGRASRAEQEALRAQDDAARAQEKTEQLRQDQERQRITQLERELERRDIERKLAEVNANKSNNTFIILGILVLILLFAVIGLSMVVLRKKP